MTTISKQVPEGITEKARELWLAGLGLFSTVEEEGEKLFNQFIEKGRTLEEKGESFEKKAMDQFSSFTNYVTEKTGQITEDISNKVTEVMPAFIEEKYHAALDTFGISTRSEVNALIDKVNKLTEVVATLVQKVGDNGKTPTKAITKTQ